MMFRLGIPLLLTMATLADGAPQDAPALTDEGLRLAASGRQEEAAKLWEQAVARAPDYFPALFNLGYFLVQEKKFAEAEPLLARAAVGAPKDFNSRYLLGLARTRLGRSDDGLRAWREALVLQPDNLRLMQIMSVEYAKGRYFTEAAALASRALELKSNDPDLYFLAIKSYQDAGDDAAAARVALRAVERFPDSARTNFEHGYHLQKAGKTREATVYLQRAMKLDPAYEEPFFFYGNMLVDEDKYEEAVQYLQKAILNRNDYVPARVVLARALMKLEKWDEAIAELNETIALDPRHPQPHLLLSQIWFRRGDEAKATSEKQISLRLRRENPGILEAAQARPFPAK